MRIKDKIMSLLKKNNILGTRNITELDRKIDEMTAGLSPYYAKNLCNEW